MPRRCDPQLAVERIVDAPTTAATDGVARPMAAVVTADGRSRADVARHYMQRVDLANLLPINKTSAKEGTMISLLGSPRMPLTTVAQNERASDLVKRNLVTESMSPLFRLQGLEPAIADLKALLAQADPCASSREACFAGRVTTVFPRKCKQPPEGGCFAAYDYREEARSVLGRPGSDLLFQALRLSTIGAGEINGRVRDGIGFRLPANTTRPAKDRRRKTDDRGQIARLRRVRFPASWSCVIRPLSSVLCRRDE